MIINNIQGYEFRRVNQFINLVRKPSDDAEDKSDKFAGKGYYWSREKSERWQLFIKRLRERNERIKKENEDIDAPTDGLFGNDPTPYEGWGEFSNF